MMYTSDDLTVRVRVWVRSVPGMYAQYDGHVDVWVMDPNNWDDCFDKAVKQLQRTSFPERSASCWRLEKVEWL